MADEIRENLVNKALLEHLDNVNKPQQDNTDGIRSDLVNQALAEHQANSSINPALQTAGDAVRGVAQGATLGFADELTGAGEAAYDKAKGLVTGEETPSFHDLYRKHQLESQTAYEDAKKRSPYAYGAGNIAGMVGTGLATGGGLAAGTEGLGAGLVRAAGQGAALGGLQAAGESQGNLDDAEGTKKLATDTAVGGATGAVLGPVVHGAVEGVKGLAGYFGKAPMLQQMLAAKNLGNAGASVNRSSGAFDKLSGITQDNAKNLGGKFLDATNAIGGQIEDAVGNATANGTTLNLGPEATDAVNNISQHFANNQFLKGNAKTSGLIGQLQQLVGTGVSPDAASSIRQQLIDIAESPNAPEGLPDAILGPNGLANQIRGKLVQAVPELEGLYNAFSSIKGAGQETLLSKGVPTEAAKVWSGGLKNQDQSVFNAADDVLSNYTGNTTGRQQASRTVNDLLSNLQDVDQKNPGLLENYGIDLSSLKQEITDGANTAQVVRTTNRGTAGSSITNTVTGVGQNVANRIANTAGKIQSSGVGQVVSTLYNAPSETLKTVADKLTQAGMTNLGQALSKNLESNSPMKNSILFSIMQNPQARSAISGIVGTNGSDDVK